jgi:SAM-dependent methyltransferase
MNESIERPWVVIPSAARVPARPQACLTSKLVLNSRRNAKTKMSRDRWNPERLQSESSYSRACLLITAAHLDLFDRIGTREITAGALAAALGGGSAGWEIFLDALCAMGLLRKRGRRYANTRFAARHLRGGGATPLLPGYDSWHVWGALAAKLTAGARPRMQEPFSSDPLKASRLLRGLEFHARRIAPFLLKKLSLSRARTLLDVGGGLGTFSCAFCRRYPGLQATVVEHPAVLPLVRRAVSHSRLRHRVQVIGRDFTRSALPRGFDTVLLSNVLHAHGADANRSLLRKVYRSLNPGGHLILRDVFMSRNRTAPAWGALFSVLLYLHTPQGRCYTADEILGWLRQTGFSGFKGPYPSSPLSFDPDSILIARKK